MHHFHFFGLAAHFAHAAADGPVLVDLHHFGGHEGSGGAFGVGQQVGQVLGVLDVFDVLKDLALLFFRQVGHEVGGVV